MCGEVRAFVCVGEDGERVEYKRGTGDHNVDVCIAVRFGGTWRRRRSLFGLLFRWDGEATPPRVSIP